MADGRRRPFDPTRCRVTVWHCCPTNTKPGSQRYPEYAHQCHEPPVRDGLCLHHFGDRARLLASASR
jgi:hypothetical protein